eukprot:TRINITY_DN2114_c0_g1_i1.p1 TRINITY_DN2114_c0_g1~~TRINITY_DN2114_c0_g1_i1.p1  ORF type:complete len:179 (-),score=4.58 TRINITY_DN2114_c0_g1_i1:464-1000(-)
MLDSGDVNCQNVSGWGCVAPDQVEWYRATALAQQEEQSRLRSRLGLTNTNADNMVPALSFFHIPLPEFMNMWNNFPTNGSLQGDYYGMTLSYRRKTGYGGYGPPPGWLRGARVIEITESPFSIRTWLRMEDGSTVMHQPQNSPGTNQTYVCCGSAGYTGQQSQCETYSRAFMDQNDEL